MFITVSWLRTCCVVHLRARTEDGRRSLCWSKVEGRSLQIFDFVIRNRCQRLDRCKLIVDILWIAYVINKDERISVIILVKNSVITDYYSTSPAG
jgi:hypothetical protein